MARSISLLITYLVVVAAQIAAAQTTITVGQGGGYDYDTIQAAIDAATTGDTVVVHPGTYYENIHFGGKDIVLRSTIPEDWDVTSSTVINGDGTDSVVTFAGSETAGCLLAGFTIRRGYASSGGGICGGSPMTCARATIRNNIIRQNRARGAGGGIALCDGRILDNSILLNNSNYGGGLYECGGTIQSNIIAGNSAHEFGGGLANCNAEVLDNRIANNYALMGGGLAGCYRNIRGNVITRNFGILYGSGLAHCGNVQNNIISHNRCEGAPQWRGSTAAYCSGVIENNTIAYNFGASVLYGCNGTIRNSIFHWNHLRGNAAIAVEESSVPSYCCFYKTDWDTRVGVGNLTAFAEFRTLDEVDFHLWSSSPCIDKGDPASDYSREPKPNGERANIGAYGNTIEATPAFPDIDADSLPDDWERYFFGSLNQGPNDDPDGDGLSNLEESAQSLYSHPAPPRDLYVDGSLSVSGNGMSRETAFRTIQEGIHRARRATRLIVAPGRYVENIAFYSPGDVVIQSTDPSSPTVVAKTIIDGRYSGSVVTLAGGSGVLAGFTIENGLNNEGGGIHGFSAEMTIRNNVIRNNLAETHWLPGRVGGGIYYCRGVIENNTISGNCAFVGGGLYFCEGIIRKNLIRDNRGDINGGGLAKCGGLIQENVIMSNAAYVGLGGGLFLCRGTIEYNIIEANWAREFGGALGECDGTIRSNTITSNSSQKSGGGLYDCKGTVRNNIICDNSARFYGGGLSLCNGTIHNNTIAANSAGSFGGGLYQCEAEIVNCIVWGNHSTTGSQLHRCSSPTYSCIQNWTGGGVGNISADPMFTTGPLGAYYLSQVMAGQAAQSPCVDAGSSTALELSLADRATRTDGWWDTGIVDMGYHYPITPSFSATRSERWTRYH